MKFLIVVLAAAVLGGVALAVWSFRGTAVDQRGATLMINPKVARRDGIAKDVEDLVTKLGVAVAKGADRIEFFKQKIEWSNVSQWTIAKKVVGTADQLEKARAVLLSEETYSWDRRGGHKKCGGFQPRDVVRFWRGNESVTFLICFTCSDVGVIYHDSAGGARVWMIADSSPGKAKLKEVMEMVFGKAAGDQGE